jgi:hypothetical protein
LHHERVVGVRAPTRADGESILTFRVTARDDDETKVLKLDGHLTLEEVPVLLEEVETKGAPLRLDLTHLLSADRDGLATLRRLREAGVALLGVSPYVALLLDDGGSLSRSPRPNGVRPGDE